jgi:hypothetical protein
MLLSSKKKGRKRKRLNLYGKKSKEVKAYSLNKVVVIKEYHKKKETKEAKKAKAKEARKIQQTVKALKNKQLKKEKKAQQAIA